VKPGAHCTKRPACAVSEGLSFVSSARRQLSSCRPIGGPQAASCPHYALAGSTRRRSRSVDVWGRKRECSARFQSGHFGTTLGHFWTLPSHPRWAKRPTFNTGISAPELHLIDVNDGRFLGNCRPHHSHAGLVPPAWARAAEDRAHSSRSSALTLFSIAGSGSPAFSYVRFVHWETINLLTFNQ